MQESTDFQGLFSIESEDKFISMAIKVCQYQYENNEVYRSFCDLLDRDVYAVDRLTSIPFLPIRFFKTEKLVTGKKQPELRFLSSGTVNNKIRSAHYIARPEIYKESLLSTFKAQIGDPKEYKFYSLLPNYRENPDSSLIFMIEFLSTRSRDKKVFHFGNDHEALLNDIESSLNANTPCLLFGVSFALIDLAEKRSLNLSGLTIIETGGMKGKRKEITRLELHQLIREGLNPSRIISEYGMTELLSQAYTDEQQIFNGPFWFRTLCRDLQDPLSVKELGTGALNIIDLANIDSIAFVGSDDIGRVHANGGFEVLGRTDDSEIRGCNLLHP